MSVLAAALAVLLLVGGAAGLYLTTSNQRLVAAPLPSRTARVAGLASLFAALALLLGLMGPATAIFTWMIGLMLAWTIPPVVIGWLRHRKELMQCRRGRSAAAIGSGRCRQPSCGVSRWPVPT